MMRDGGEDGQERTSRYEYLLRIPPRHFHLRAALHYFGKERDQDTITRQSCYIKESYDPAMPVNLIRTRRLWMVATRIIPATATVLTKAQIIN